MCDPDNPSSKLKSVNMTEARVCGLPKTSSSNITSSENTTSEGIATVDGSSAVSTRRLVNYVHCYYSHGPLSTIRYG